MNENILYTLAGVATTLGGFSGVVIVLRPQGARAWSSTDLRYLWFFVGDSFLVVMFSLLPIPLLLMGFADDLIWGICNALLGTWLIAATIIALRGEFNDHKRGRLVTIPIVSSVLNALSVFTLLLAAALWLSVFDVLGMRGQAIYVLGLLLLLAFAGLEFMFFIGRASPEKKD